MQKYSSLKAIKYDDIDKSKSQLKNTWQAKLDMV